MVDNYSNPIVKQLKVKYEKEARYVTLVILSVVGATIMGYWSHTTYLLLSKKNSYISPYPTSYHFDHTTPASYTFVLICEFLSGVICTCMFCAVDSLFATLTLFACMQYNILKLSIEKSDSVENISDTSDTVYLKHCTHHHQTIYKFCEMLEDIYSPIVMIQLGFSGVTLSFIAFQLTQTTSDMNKIATYLSFFSSIISSLFLYCWYGDMLTNESFSVTNILYNTKWYEKSFQYRTIIQFMIVRSQKQIYITAMGFVTATLESFTTILKTAVSYFTLLGTMSEEVGIDSPELG